jgi:phospholipid/cholesterol/gamma-HCH transport system permease protein
MNEETFTIEPPLAVRSLTMAYGETVIQRDIDFTVNRGDIFIIMAGRTGAAYAAQLGAMQGNDEIDAFRTLGISPVDYLVLPRLIALTLMVPLLTVYADVMGILGGGLVGVAIFDITPIQYLVQTRESVALTHFWVGLTKSAVYGGIVAFSGCLRGMLCGRSAADVGTATTSAVVTAIVWIIVACAILTVIFHVLGL